MMTNEGKFPEGKSPVYEAYKCAYAIVVALERLANLTESLIAETQLLNQRLETMNREKQ